MSLNRFPLTLLLTSILGLATAPAVAKLDRPEVKCLTVPMYFPGAGIQFTRAVADDVAYLNPDMLRMEFIGTGDPTNSIDYGAYDYVVDRAGERGIAILGLVDYASVKWQSTADWGTEWFRDTFEARVRELVTHYHDRPHPIRHWEIWNEPDIQEPSFNVRIEPEPYALLLIRCFEAIKEIDPGATVVLGGISPKGLYYGENYLADLYATQPIKDFFTANAFHPFDVVAVHPYPEIYSNPNPGLKTVLQTHVKSVMNANGDRFKKVWLTEMGWSSYFVSESTQAAYLTSSFEIVDDLVDTANPGDAPYVEKYFWFQYEDFSPVDRWGLYTDGRTRRKPSYNAFLALTDPGPEPPDLTPGPGEEPPVWNTTGDAALPHRVANDDLVAGRTPSLASGGFHPASQGTLAALTNGLFDTNGVTLVLADYDRPSLRVRWDFPAPVDITEVRSFAGHDSSGGNRAFQSLDILADGVLVRSDLTSGAYGQVSGGNSAVSLVRALPAAGEMHVARGVTRLEVAWHPVSTLDGNFVDRWDPVDDPQDDLDGAAPAYVSTIVKELDVLGAPSPPDPEAWVLY